MRTMYYAQYVTNLPKSAQLTALALSGAYHTHDKPAPTVRLWVDTFGDQPADADILDMYRCNISIARAVRWVSAWWEANPEGREASGVFVRAPIVIMWHERVEEFKDYNGHEPCDIIGVKETGDMSQLPGCFARLVFSVQTSEHAYSAVYIYDDEWGVKPFQHEPWLPKLDSSRPPTQYGFLFVQGENPSSVPRSQKRVHSTDGGNTWHS